MKRSHLSFIVGFFWVFMLAAGCTGTPSVSGSAQTSPLIQDPALAQLCNARDRTSLAGIATALERPDDKAANMAQVSESLKTAEANLKALDLGASVRSPIEKALIAIDDLQKVIDDPGARGKARTRAAEALRSVDAAICP